MKQTHKPSTKSFFRKHLKVLAIALTIAIVLVAALGAFAAGSGKHQSAKSPNAKQAQKLKKQLAKQSQKAKKQLKKAQKGKNKKKIKKAQKKRSRAEIAERLNYSPRCARLANRYDIVPDGNNGERTVYTAEKKNINLKRHKGDIETFTSTCVGHHVNPDYSNVLEYAFTGESGYSTQTAIWSFKSNVLLVNKIPADYNEAPSCLPSFATTKCH